MSDLSSAISWIARNGYRRVAIQLPADCLHRAPSIVRVLKFSLTQVEVFVLGDTSYGHCCVDEVGAEHYGADSVLHFGYSCGSLPERLPTLCLFDSQSSSFNSSLPADRETVLVLSDPRYSADELSICSRLVCEGRRVILAKAMNELVPLAKQQPQRYEMPKPEYNSILDFSNLRGMFRESARLFFSPPLIPATLFGRKLYDVTNIMIPRTLPLVKASTTCLFIGPADSPILERALLWFPDGNFFHATETGHLNALSNLRPTMRRFAGVEAVKRADTVGLLYAASSLTGLVQAREKISSALRQADKKVHAFCVGKLSDAKLGNFPEVEVFVVLGCGDFLSSELLTAESRARFHCPLVTAHEVSLALDLDEWEGCALSDILDTAWCQKDAGVVTAEPATPCSSTDSQEFIKSLTDVRARVYAGLETGQSATPPALVENGLSGIPARYVSETLL